DVSAPFLFVQVPYAGSTPEEVERNILRPVEETLSTMTDVKSMEGNATSEQGSVFLMFSDWDRDIEIAAAEARERIDAIRSELPDDLQRYFVWKWSTSDEPALELRLTSTSLDLTKEYDRIDRVYKRRLERIPGVAKVEVEGAPQNEVEIAIDQDRLNAHGLALNDLDKRLRAVNFSVSAGQIDDGTQRLRVQPIGELSDLQQLRDTNLAPGVRLSDVADVRLKPEKMPYGRRLDGRPAAGIDVYKERDANLVDVSRRVRAELEAIQAEGAVPDIDMLVQWDAGESVTGSLLSLAEAGGIGLLLSIAVLYFFLRHWPSTLMVTTAIPICFVMTLGFMYFAGVTLNVLTMMGLLLAIGMLVDNAVVVVESIYQERERLGGDPALASIIGTRHVAIALSAGTLCHCIVFVPNLFGEKNMISIYMGQIAITICVSLLASWLVAVSLIPMLSARMKTPPAVRNEKGLIMRLQRRYAALLRWTLEHRGLSVLGILLIVAVSVVPLKMTKVNMFGGEDIGELDVYYQWKGAYTKEQMSAEIDKVEAYLDANRKRFGIEQVFSRYREQGWAGTNIKFAKKDGKEIAEITETLRKEMPKSARATIGIGDQGGPGGGGQQGKEIQVMLVGDSSQTLSDLAKDIVPMLAQRKELRDVRVDNGDQNSELAVHVDRERAASFGFSANDVATFVGLALRGAPLREFRRGDTEVPVWVRFA
ncbi:MAG TPA: efflux RND transporter permease subunit, partial [Lysobacter sp.]|nr:efflux RND transporter permease subunit [Lysobacter sp.]